MSSFTEQFHINLTNPEYWDIGAAGYATLDEFWKDLGKKQRLAASGEIRNAGECLDYAKSYEIHYKALAKVNAKIAAEFTTLSEADKKLLNTMRSQERELKLVVDRLKAAGTSNLDSANIKRIVAKYAPIAGKNLGGFIGISQILTAVDSGRADEVGRTSAGVLAGFLLGNLGAAGGAALAGLFVAGGPIVWIAAALGAVVFGYGGEKFTQAVWDTWISSDADRKVRGLIEQAKEIYGTFSETAQQVEEQLKGSAEKLGNLDGTWLEGYDELTSSERAFLTYLFFAPSGSLDRFTDRINDDTAEFNAFIADLTSLFDAPWRSGYLVVRDKLLILVNEIARDRTFSYTQPYVIASDNTLIVDIPDDFAQQNDALQKIVRTFVTSDEVQYVGNVEVTTVRIAINSGNLGTGATSDDLLIGSNAVDTLNGDAGFDYLVGGGGADSLSGGAGVDVIFGGADGDILDGGEGTDYLLGGEGNDEYIFSGTYSQDTIIDTDGQGRIRIDGQSVTGGQKVAENYWISVNKQFGFTLVSNAYGNHDLVISQGSSPNTIRVRNWQDGQLGITLSGSLEPPPSTNTIRGGRQYNPPPVPTTITDNLGNLIIYIPNPQANDVLNGDRTAGDTIYGGDGNDMLAGHGGKDILEGEDGDDALFGGADDDFINGGDGVDIIWGDFEFSTYSRFGRLPNPPLDAQIVGEGWYAYIIDGRSTLRWNVALFNYAEGADVIVAGAGDDWVKADFGNDIVELGAGNDSANGDDGNDTLFGDDGSDRILGDYLAVQGQDGRLYLVPFEGQGTDILDGGAGDDTLNGGGRGDILYGDEGNDTLYGDDVDGYHPISYHGDDFLDGGAGIDLLYGSGGSDQLYGGDDDDQLSGDNVYETGKFSPNPEDHGDDTLDGGAGNDTLRGDGGDDELYGGTGNDILSGDGGSVQAVPGEFHGRDYLDGEAGNDELQGDGNDDTLWGGEGNDTLFGDGNVTNLPSRFHGKDYLAGEAGDDYLEGGGNDDELYGGEGADTLIGDSTSTALEIAAHGNDDLAGGAGNDNLLGNGGDDILDGGDGNDQLVGDAAVNSSLPGDANGSDILDGGDGDDFLLGGGKNDDLYGGIGNDTLVGDNVTDDLLDAAFHGDDYLDGGNGDDELAGNGGADVLVGGSGNDRLFGDGDVAGGGDDLLFGDDGNDILIGGDGNDTLDGGAGDDELIGEGGNDTYIFSYGSGNDIIFDVDGINTISLTGVATNDVKLNRTTDGSLLITLNSTGETLTVIGYFATNSQATRISAIAFDNGTSLTPTDIRTRIFGGTNSSDTLTGSNSNDIFDGDAGNDTITGGGGNDDLSGGAGNDELFGDDGNDFLRGGLGFDWMYGGEGNNTYYFARGDGQDVIHDVGGLIIDQDKLILLDLNPTDVRLVQSVSNLLIFVKDTTDWLSIIDYFQPTSAIEQIEFADGQIWDVDRINRSLTTRFIGGVGNDRFFGSTKDDYLDGGAGNDTISGGISGNDYLIGGVGNDELNGDSGSDTYVFSVGDGQDYIFDDYSGTNRIVFGAGISSANITVSLISAANRQPAYNNYYFPVVSDSLLRHIQIRYSANDSITLPLIYSRNGDFLGDYLPGEFVVAFADGVEISLSELVAQTNLTPSVITGTTNNDLLYDGLGNDTLNGGAGNDIIVTYFGNNVVDGGAGSDRIYGSIGNNTYLFSLGMGFDTVFESSRLTPSSRGKNRIRVASGITPADVKITRPQLAGEFDQSVDSRTGNELVLRHKNGTDKLLIVRWDRDGFTVDSIEFADGTVWDAREIQRQLIIGNDGNDEIYGTSLTELIRGGAGDDTLESVAHGSTNDVLMGDDGNDRITTGGKGIPHLSGGTGDDRFDLYDPAIIDPGKGNDAINYASQNSSLFFDRGYGQDIVNYGNLAYGGWGSDIIFGSSISPNEVIVSARQLSQFTSFGQTYRNLTSLSFRIGNSADILILPFVQLAPRFDGEVWIPPKGSVIFSDGTRWDLGTITQRLSVVSSDYDDSIVGSENSDLINAGAGNDTLYGNKGNDTINGGVGNDTIYGNEGDDVIDGGSGDDTLDGGDGNDTYIFRRGSGRDYYDYPIHPPVTNNLDTIQIAALPNEITLSYVETEIGRGSLSIRINNTTDEFYVSSWFWRDSSLNTLQLKFSNGIVWDAAAIAANTSPLSNLNQTYRLGTFLADTFLPNPLSQSIYSGAGDDRIEGGAGNDSLDGGIGNDYLDGGTGNDSLIGGLGDDTYVFGYGYGNDSIIEISGGSDSSLNYGYDTIRFTADVRPQDVTYTYDAVARNFVLTLAGSSDRLTIDNFWEYTQSRVERAVFADGTEWNLLINRSGAINGTAGTDQIIGTVYNDIINGGAGADTINGGFGDDQIDGGDGADIISGGKGNNRIDGGTGNDSLTGGSENDTLIGGLGDDTINGGGGSDIVEGGVGNDTIYVYTGTKYLFKRGDGADVIPVQYGQQSFQIILDAGILPSDMIVSRVSNYDRYGTRFRHEVTLAIANTTDSVRLLGANYNSSNINDTTATIVFADGTIWTWNDIISKFNPIGTSGNDILSAPSQGTELLGNGGDDLLSGGAGDDTLRGGAGVDDLWSGGGNDFLDGGADGIVPTFSGAKDVLAGGSGDDTYFFDRGYGWDVIEEYYAGGVGPKLGEINRLVFGSTIAPTDISFARDTINDEYRSSSDLHLQIRNTTDRLTIKYFFGEDFRPNSVHSVIFSDGTVWDRTELVNRYWANAPVAGQIEGTTLFLPIEGTEGNNQFLGFPGSDKLYGYGGSDRLNGNGGDDEIYGGSGNDILDDAAGNDLLNGGVGDDTYFFGRGYGNDLIIDFDRLNGADKIYIVGDLCPSDIEVTRDDIHIFLSVKGTEDKLAIRWFPHPNYEIELIEFAACGTVWDNNKLEAVTNGEPFIAPVFAHAIANQQVNEDSLFNFTIPTDTFSDSEVNDSLTYSAILSNGNPLPSWLTFNPVTRSFTGTPDNANVGTVDIRVTATDRGGLSAFDVLTLAVINVNDRPIVNREIANQTVSANEVFTFTFTDNTFTDVDAGDFLNYAATLSNGNPLPSWLNFDRLTRTFRGIPADQGNLEIEVTATDQAGSSISDRFTLTITDFTPPVNNNTVTISVSSGFILTPIDNDNPPILNQAIAPVNVDEDSTDTLIDLNNLFTDADGDTITITVVNNTNPILLLANITDNKLNLDYQPQQFGTTAITLRGTANNKTVDYTFTVNVNSVNDTPTLAKAIADQTITVDSLFSFTVPIDTFNDIDTGDILTYSATLADNTTLPNWLTFNPATLTFTGTPTTDDLDVLNIKVTARDIPGATVADIFTLTVSDSNNVINGDDNNNTLIGTVRADRINGFGSDDYIEGAGGNDTIDGGNGKFDRIFGGAGDDIIIDPDGILGAHGGAGNDTITITFAASWDNDTNSTNSPRSDGKITGGYGDDKITVTMNNSKFYINLKGDEPTSNTPQDGNDIITLQGSYGNSVIDLGGGNDIFTGGSGNDSVSGQAGDDTIFGFAGNDQLAGNDGNDTLVGGAGNDNLIGGNGKDLFSFNSPIGHGIDTLTDFNPVDDTIGIDAAGFGNGLVFGTLAETQFVLGTAAQDESDRLIYNQLTGSLFFDADGTGSIRQVQFATLTTKPVISQTNILVF